MAERKCPYCYSTEVEIIASYETREVTVIRCRRCGKESPLDMENPNVDVTDPSHETNPNAAS